MDEIEDDPGIRLGVAANLSRLAAEDQRFFLDTLASMLESALPGRVHVHRKGGVFTEKQIRAVEIHLGEQFYSLESLAAGMLIASRSRVVRGIKLKTETVPLQEWLDELTGELEEYARDHQAARDALKRFVGS